MVIDDKCWTLLGHHEREFYSVLEKFVNHCKPYIPLNNEHNEPTEGDIGETSNEPTQATRNEFEELYASANEELYAGCDYMTRLDFMEKFTYFKVKGNLTDSIFNEILEFFQNVFPISKGYKLLSLYYAIKKTFKMIGLGYESIHACKHDCCLFRGDDNKDLDFYQVCNMSRWKDSNTPGKKVPKKRCQQMLPGPMAVTIEVRIAPSTPCTQWLHGCFANRDQTLTTQEYSSLIDTFFVAYTVNGKFLQDEDWRIYEEMRRLEAMGIYTDDEINRLAREGNSEGTLPVWPQQKGGFHDEYFQMSGGASRSGGCGDEEEGADNQDDEDEDGDGDT
nr:hypothetical protein [Tanacetum cinerariifolium]